MADTAPKIEATPTPKKRRKGCWIAFGIFAVILIGLGAFYGPVLMMAYRHGFLDRTPNDEKYSATSQENLKALYKALSLYHDSEGQFPTSSGWMDAIENRIDTYNLAKGEAEKKMIRPDLLGQDGKFGYAMNDAVSGKYKDDIKDKKTPLIFESTDTGRNAHGDPAKIRHGYAISVDGTIIKPDKS